MLDQKQLAKMSVTELLDTVTHYTSLKKGADENLKKEIEEFEKRKEIRELQKIAADSELATGEVREVLLERMRKENMQSCEAQSGHAHITKKVKVKWTDDASMIEAINNVPDLESLKEFVVQKIVKPDTMQKKLLEIIEIENPKELEGLVEQTDVYTLTVTAKKDE